MLHRALRLTVLVTAIAVLGRYALIALGTLDYACQLEWMEGGVLDVIARVHDGKPIYAAPSLEYVPHIYPPVYFWVCGWLSKVFGLSLFVPRMVSFLSVLGVFGLIARAVHRHGSLQSRGSWTWAWAAAAFFAITYDVSGKWFHLARVDSLALFLALLSFDVLIRAKTTRQYGAAVVLAAAATFTKQTMFVLLLPAFLGVQLASPTPPVRLRSARGIVLLVLAAAVPLWLRGAADGWFWYYVVDLPRTHAWLDEARMGFWKQDVLPVAVAMAAAVLALARMFAERGRRALPYAGLLVGAVAGAWISRLHSGGFFNVLMPMHAAVAVLLGMGIAQLEREVIAFERARSWVSPTEVGVVLLLAYQLMILPGDLDASFPKAGSAEKCAQFAAFVESIPGSVLLPDYRDPAHMKNARFGLEMPARDVLRAPEGDRGRAVLEPALNQAIAAKRFRAIILSEPVDWTPYLKGHYRPEQVIDLAPPPITGWAITPRQVWVPSGGLSP